MKRLGQLVSASICLFAFAVPNMVVADELGTSLWIITRHVARIRAISESCNIQADPMLEVRVAEALAPIGNLDVAGLHDMFLKQYNFEKKAIPSGCAEGSEDSLAVLGRLYERGLADLKKQVSDQYPGAY